MDTSAPPSVSRSRLLSLPFLRVSRKNKILFYTCLATLFEGGIPLARAFALLQKQQSSPVLRLAARTIARHLAEGESLAGSFALYPNLFSNVELRLIAFAEQTGKLPQVFAQLAHSFQTVRGFWTTVISGLIYPICLVLTVVIFIPILKSLFLGGTEELLAALAKQTIQVLSSLILIWLVAKLAMQLSGMRRVFHSLLLGVPFLRGVIYRFARARFAYVLNTMYQAGIPMLESLSVAADSCGNQAIAAKLKRTAPLVKEGLPLTQALEQSGVFSPVAIGILASGEESGMLDAMLQKFGDWEQKEAETAVERWARMIPFVLYLAVMVAMVYMIVSFYTNYYGQLLNL